MGEPVDSLNDNDVLFGRGAETSFYIGTQRFRDLIEPKKEAYMRASKRSEKNALAAEIVAAVREKGGRFLRQDETAEPVDDIVEHGTWYEVNDDKEILKKTKQGLRQMSNPVGKRGRSTDENDSSTSANDGFVDMVPPAVLCGEDTLSAFSAMNLLPPAAPALAPSVPPTLDPRLLLFNQAAISTDHYTQALLLQQQQALLASSLLSAVPLPGSSSAAHLAGMSSSVSPGQAPTTVQSQWQQVSHSVSPSDNGHTGSVDFSSVTKSASTEDDAACGDQKLPSPKKNDPDEMPSTENNGEEVAEDIEEFLLSVLQLSGLPTFTDHATERANMTDEERAAALSDMYGKYCDADMHKNKRTRRDLDPESIAFLVKHMRSELEQIPVKKKQALLEAEKRCEPSEFSDERLERFLRCERMDVQLAAKRFVKYWEKRREVFGPDKFTMRMTLSEALCDDLVALEVGWLQLLPKLDASGRQLVLLTPACHNKEGYTSESLLRAAWYMIEVASRANKDIDSGVVELVNDKGCTIWEYDHWVYTRFTEFLLTCWPCRFDCFHVFNASEFISRVVVPIICALQSKQSRARTNWHDVPEDDIISALIEYGITGDMLPTEFGGTIQLNPSEWIAHRRAVEMEEL